MEIRPGRGYCSICYSDFNKEINIKLRKGYSLAELSREYCVLLDNTPQTFYVKLRAHQLRKHAKRKLAQEQVNMLVEKLEEGPLPNTVEAYAKKLLDVGLSDGMLTDKKVSHNAVIGAQRLLIEKAKLKTQQDALKISMLKMMRGTFGEEGEVVDGRSRVIESNTD